jgi:metal-dependent amidase/aminoacylase/carboxypeptidase family protein
MLRPNYHTDTFIFRIIATTQSKHSARPWRGSNPIISLYQLVQFLNTRTNIQGRHGVVNILELHSGTHLTVTPNQAEALIEIQEIKGILTDPTSFLEEVLVDYKRNVGCQLSFSLAKL